MARRSKCSDNVIRLRLPICFDKEDSLLCDVIRLHLPICFENEEILLNMESIPQDLILCKNLKCCIS